MLFVTQHTEPVFQKYRLFLFGYLAETYSHSGPFIYSDITSFIRIPDGDKIQGTSVQSIKENN